MKTNSLSAWILAIRPYSLGNSVILILIGSALAFTDGGFRPVVALLCLVFAVTMQCTANLVNDLCDFLKGADRPDRLGPDRAFAKGYITLRAMKSGIAAFTLAACAAGVGLLALSGWNWWLLLVGASCIVFAYFYTAGPWPLAYHGMGDIAVILFFGLIPVGFTYYLQCGTWSGETAVVGLACGMVIDTMLMINNFRDREEDRRCNKRTIVVCPEPQRGAGVTWLWAQEPSCCASRCWPKAVSPQLCCLCPTLQSISPHGARWYASTTAKN